MLSLEGLRSRSQQRVRSHRGTAVTEKYGRAVYSRSKIEILIPSGEIQNVLEDSIEAPSCGATRLEMRRNENYMDYVMQPWNIADEGSTKYSVRAGCE